MSDWKKFPDMVGDWIEIEVWDCGCIHTIKSHEVRESNLEEWANYKSPGDIYFLRIDLPARRDGVIPCRPWRVNNG